MIYSTDVKLWLWNDILVCKEKPILANALETCSIRSEAFFAWTAASKYKFQVPVALRRGFFMQFHTCTCVNHSNIIISPQHDENDISFYNQMHHWIIIYKYVQKFSIIWVNTNQSIPNSNNCAHFSMHKYSTNVATNSIYFICYFLIHEYSSFEHFHVFVKLSILNKTILTEIMFSSYHRPFKVTHDRHICNK